MIIKQFKMKVGYCHFHFFLLLAVLVILAGCAAPEARVTALRFPALANADPDGTLVFSLLGDISMINPVLSSDSASAAVEGVIFNGLVTINEKLEIVPELATSWTASLDGRVWTFHLRKRVFWHDGYPFTAEDVKFTFDSILDPKVNSVRRADYIIDGIPIRFEVVNLYTFRAILSKPFAPFLSHMAMGILPKHLLANKDLNTAAFNRQPVGTGPFKFVSFRPAEKIEVARSDQYFRGRPRVAHIIYRVIPDANAQLVALETGEIDETGIPAKDYRRMLRTAHINIFEFDSLAYTYLGLNNRTPLFSDRRVRQALAYATDKDQLAKLLFRGLARPAYAPSAPASWAYSDDVAKYPYDPAKARRRLELAGYIAGPDGFYAKAGRTLEFTILTNQGNKEREKAAVILEQQYRKIGVKVKVLILEWSALLKIINAPEDPKKFDAIIIGWSLGIDPDDYSIWHSSQYPAGLNFVGYRNRRADRLLEAGRTTIERGGRKRIYAELDKVIAWDQPYVFLWYPKSVVGVRDRVGGLAKPGPAGLFLRMEKVFVEKN